MNKIGKILISIISLGVTIYLLVFMILSLTSCDNTAPKSEATILFEQLKETFTGNIVDGTNLEFVDITGDNTLYYNDEFGIATVLGEEWKGYSIGIRNTEDDLEYSGEVIQIKRPMILFGTLWDDEEHRNLYLMEFYHYGFSIFSNEDVEKLKASPSFWTTSYMQWYRGENNKYSFFETSARNGSQRYLLYSFPNLDCRTWTGGIEYDIDGNSYEYIDADCNGYEAINGEAVKTRKSWIEQLFPYGFIFYDIE